MSMKIYGAVAAVDVYRSDYNKIRINALKKMLIYDFAAILFARNRFCVTVAKLS